MDQGGSLGTPNMVLGQPVWSPEALQNCLTSKCFYRSPDSTVYHTRSIPHTLLQALAYILFQWVL